MMKSTVSARVAVVGAGVAGVSCARQLADAGHAVQLFDKSRGVGGRLATRQVEWVDEHGGPREAAFDHGAPGFTARSADFAAFVGAAQRAGWLAPWAPVLAPSSHEALDALTRWVPVPDMPSLCRRLLGDLPLHLSSPVEALWHGADGWQLACAGGRIVEGFDQLVLALPPQQVATLLHPHRADWAQQARALSMLSCWTLMGVAESAEAVAWEQALPTRGPLSSITRNESKPGRAGAPRGVHWVAHATADWSQTHLETPAAEVQALLQAALADALGQALSWNIARVHRWRYACVPRAIATVPGRCWWDASLGLGVCGDALGGAGVEGAWACAKALAGAMRTSAGPLAPRPKTPPPPQPHGAGFQSPPRRQGLGAFPSSFLGLRNEGSTP